MTFLFSRKKVSQTIVVMNFILYKGISVSPFLLTLFHPQLPALYSNYRFVYQVTLRWDRLRIVKPTFFTQASAAYLCRKLAYIQECTFVITTGGATSLSLRSSLSRYELRITSESLLFRATV